jgi:hypothetical protein
LASSNRKRKHPEQNPGSGLEKPQPKRKKTRAEDQEYYRKLAKEQEEQRKEQEAIYEKNFGLDRCSGHCHIMRPSVK